MQMAMTSNKSIDMDVVAAGFVRLCTAGHFRRYAARGRHVESS